MHINIVEYRSTGELSPSILLVGFPAPFCHIWYFLNKKQQHIFQKSSRLPADHQRTGEQKSNPIRLAIRGMVLAALAKRTCCLYCIWSKQRQYVVGGPQVEVRTQLQHRRALFKEELRFARAEVGIYFWKAVLPWSHVPKAIPIQESLQECAG